MKRISLFFFVVVQFLTACHRPAAPSQGSLRQRFDSVAVLSGGMYNGSFGVNQNDGNGRNFDVWKNKNQSTYYFTKDGREYGVKGMKSVLKAFPTKKNEIKQYVHDNHIDTLTAEGMLQVIDYLMTL